MIISDHLKNEKEKDKEKNLNNKNIIGSKNSKQSKPLSTFQLTVITGKNIANRNTENLIINSRNSDSKIPDKEGYENILYAGSEVKEENNENEKIKFNGNMVRSVENENMNENENRNEKELEINDSDNDINSNDSNKDNNNNDDFIDSSTTSKAYTLTEEVQRVLIEDFYPPISSSTVPGNPGRLYISLSSSLVSSTSSMSPSSSSSSSSLSSSSRLSSSSSSFSSSPTSPLSPSSTPPPFPTSSIELNENRDTLNSQIMKENDNESDNENKNENQDEDEEHDQ